MVKKLVIVVFAFLVLVPNASGQIPVAGEDSEYANPTTGCGTADMYCEMVTFANFGTGVGASSMSGVVVQRFEGDEFYAEMLLSDMGAIEYIDALGYNAFYSYKDYTKDYADLIPSRNGVATVTGWKYRVFEGRSDTFSSRDDSTIYMLVGPDYTMYVVWAIEPTSAIKPYVRDIIKGEDWTEAPNGYIFFEG